MLYHAAKAGSFTLRAAVQEVLTAFRRAGNYCCRGLLANIYIINKI